MTTDDTGSSTPEYRNQSRLDTERRRFGGVKVGCAFFGWLTATGMAVLLTALLAAVGAAVGLGEQLDTTQVLQGAVQEAGAIGWAGGIILALVLLLAYYSGGYVAGRMARFNGLRQGLAVWLWAIVIAVVLGLLALIAGNQFNALTELSGFPRIPITQGTATAAGITALLIAIVIPLVGALLGGLAGMRFHRKVDHLDTGLRNHG